MSTSPTPANAANHAVPAQAVVFDLDGLMFNTEELYDDVGAILLQRRGARFTPELKRRMMGRPARISLQIMIDAHDLETTVAELDAESDEIFADLLPKRLRPMPGLLELLDALQEREIPKAIATSSGPGFTETVLDQFGLRSRFTFVLTSRDVQHGKPNPEVYLTAAGRLGLAPERLMVLEDSENGCRAAIDAGTVAVAVPGHHSRDHDFSGAAHIADSLEDPWIYQRLGLAVPSPRRNG